MDEKDLDPKGLIRESYKIEGITEDQCRSIFLDWALSLPGTIEAKVAIEALLIRNQSQPADHPMTSILEQGRVQMVNPKRRGGWRSRNRN
ncbi:hypothetical protein SAMN05444000_11553 [Shimia gijangensis]|uniref:Uncharacterized protein n=1 Tax=Shimia gijangensis TaxID=1470563 RepID=A0A1M6N5W2_9RHOB|nr:hypothetical protein [Shimia gijangensis]SHJ91064.1 hypothetical protein SAMN05444000_11553 [Shimia gijangensis]